MSKGNTMVPIRIPAGLLAEVAAVIERSHTTRSGEPWTRTAFILAAVREKLSHMKRSKAKRGKQSSTRPVKRSLITPEFAEKFDRHFAGK